MFREAYENYLKRGSPIVIPGLGLRHEVLMPSRYMPWVLSQRESELSSAQAFVEIDQVRWVLGDNRYVADPWHGTLVRTDMSHDLENICAALNDELQMAFDEYFSADSDSWKDIDLLNTVRWIVARAASRFTIGLPLCRNKEYLRLSLETVDGLILNAGATGGAPRILQPLVGAVVNWNVRRKIKRMKRLLSPIWGERIVALQNKRDNKEPQDYFQMMARYALEHRPNEFVDLDAMTRRLIAANFGSMHQTSIQVTNMLLNIVGSDHEYNTIAALRKESRELVKNGANTKWTKSDIAKMIKSDSVARETLRLHSFGGRAVQRKVMSDSCATPDGYHLPKGTIISFLGQPAQTDSNLLDNALKYDPFRFSRLREDTTKKQKKLNFVTTGPEYLSFGHGRHACPGRFLVDFELKMIISHVLGRYDLDFPPEYEKSRPPNYWLAEVVFPPKDVRIRVRKRPESESVLN
ncbi:hypothetical protein QQS21_003840 [Conoideocrella luteorostrata]|uniref:Cytochrome P450 n=1 Tax=Conoideocrella luteorostrata TaxID=1105319 RepID=A0AAJ0CSK3_9HYPO|nr:hypothetical protein QQS21_003840 [Conoideocrella luteorostrata]